MSTCDLSAPRLTANTPSLSETALLWIHLANDNILCCPKQSFRDSTFRPAASEITRIYVQRLVTGVGRWKCGPSLWAYDSDDTGSSRNGYPRQEGIPRQVVSHIARISERYLKSVLENHANPADRSVDNIYPLAFLGTSGGRTMRHTEGAVKLSRKCIPR